MGSRLIAVLGLCWCLLGIAWANDSTATLSTSGLILTKTDAVVMEEEDLFISEQQIRVAYVFRNTSKQDVVSRVAFPLPEFPLEADFDLPLDDQASRPLRFSLQVNGEPREFDTEILRREGKMKMTHHWMQTFPAGETVSVSHEYVPAAGGSTGFWFAGEEREQYIQQYCIEPSLERWIVRHNNDEDATVTLMPTFVDYILQTANNWQGPIGKFRLTLQKRAAEDRVSLCINGIKRQGARTFVFEKTNFIPKQDLKILFLRPYKLNQ